MYNSIIHYLWGHDSESNHLPSPYTFLYLLPAPFPSGSHYNIVCVCEFCFSCLSLCCSQFYIQHMVEIIKFLTFTIWLILLNKIFWWFIHVVTKSHILCFHGWVVFHCIYSYVLHLLFPVLFEEQYFLRTYLNPLVCSLILFILRVYVCDTYFLKRIYQNIWEYM